MIDFTSCSRDEDFPQMPASARVSVSENETTVEKEISPDEVF